jgi:hypothetical protein
MRTLNVEVLRKAAGMSPAQLAALYASFIKVGGGDESEHELGGKPDVMLLGKVAAVGAYVQPHYVGSTSVNARYPGRRVGAPAEMVATPGAAPIQYAQQQYVAGDVTWFGLGTTPIGIGLTVAVQVQPPRPFVPQQLYCPSTTQGLLVLEASIGGTNIFCGSTGVPIELLSEVSQVPMIEWPTLDPAVGIRFLINNPTLAIKNFSGALYGTQVRQ